MGELKEPRDYPRLALHCITSKAGASKKNISGVSVTVNMRTNQEPSK
jgi:hypothetical protein